MIDAAGDPKLPMVTTADAHTADTDYINVAVEARFGVKTTVLRSLSHSPPIDGSVERVHELEAHDAPTSVRWCDAPDLAKLDDPEDRRAVALWMQAGGNTQEWMQPGWFDLASDWTRRALTDAGLGVAVEIRQLRNWASSCVLRARTPQGEFYFKALPDSARVEWAVTMWLANVYPDVTPRIVASERDHRWLLMAACAGRMLEEVHDVADWETGATRYARLQADCVARVDELVELGCPPRDVDGLSRSMATLLHDTAALRCGETDGLTRAECDRLRQSLPLLQRRCDELATYRIAATIEHGDLWPGNIFVAGPTAVVIDWEDVAVGHPFFSLAPLQVGLANAGLDSAENSARLERAYLAGFSRFGPAEHLHRALSLAAPLSFIEMALRYSRQPSAIVALHPWMRDLVPQALRLALARLDDAVR